MSSQDTDPGSVKALLALLRPSSETASTQTPPPAAYHANSYNAPVSTQHPSYDLPYRQEQSPYAPPSSNYVQPSAGLSASTHSSLQELLATLQRSNSNNNAQASSSSAYQSKHPYNIADRNTYNSYAQKEDGYNAASSSGSAYDPYTGEEGIVQGRDDDVNGNRRKKRRTEEKEDDPYNDEFRPEVYEPDGEEHSEEQQEKSPERPTRNSLARDEDHSSAHVDTQVEPIGDISTVPAEPEPGAPAEDIFLDQRNIPLEEGKPIIRQLMTRPDIINKLKAVSIPMPY